ncbi:hypothetical protein HK104_006094, partial [Borealophlyctis nickersoniae]
MDLARMASTPTFIDGRKPIDGKKYFTQVFFENGECKGGGEQFVDSVAADGECR